MAIIIETCPRCGHDLTNEVICTYPPIPRKVCYGCGWYWEGEREEVIRQPFGGNSFFPDNGSALAGSMYNELINADDTGCSLNNINGYVFAATQDSLKNNTISYEKIAEAIERTQKYIKK